jgi:hypothetical protein
VDYLASVALVREGQHQNSKDGIGIRPADNAIDKALIAGWISKCDETHAGACHGFHDPWAQIRHATDILLIDVEQHCLISHSSVTGPLKYVALSYVWGEAKDSFMTLQNNVDLLSRPNAFSEHSSRLPLTVQDSMALISSLGLRYLWVDRFCIIQDGDPKTKETQLAAMASIYANAHFTLAAREGDAQTGLAGSRPERPRQKPYKTFRLRPHFRMLLHDLTTYVEEPVYDQRGWTFQEWKLSRRLLVFHSQTVSWKCSSTMEQENGTYPNDIPIREWEDAMTWGKIPDVTNYLKFVEKYCRRELRSEDDKLRAFEAIIAVLGRSLRGRMLYGLPELFFQESLLWAPSTSLSDKYLARNNTTIPSWS